MSSTNVLHRFEAMVSALVEARLKQGVAAPAEILTPLVDGDWINAWESICDLRDEVVRAAASFHVSPCDMGQYFDRICVALRNLIDLPKVVRATDAASVPAGRAGLRAFDEAMKELGRARQPLRDCLAASKVGREQGQPGDDAVLSNLGSEAAALLQRVAETERRLLENWRAQLAPILSPRRGQRLNDEAEAIAVHLAQLFAASPITSRELYGYLHSRHHWTPDTVAGLTDRQIFDAIERDVRLVLNTYAALPIPSHLLNVTYHELSQLCELIRLDIRTEDGRRYVQQHGSERLLTTVAEAWNRTPLKGLLQKRFGEGGRSGLMAAGDWLRASGLSDAQVGRLTIDELMQRLEGEEGRKTGSVEIPVAPEGSVTINPAATPPELAGLPVNVVPAWEEHREQVLQRIIAAAMSSSETATSGQPTIEHKQSGTADGSIVTLANLRSVAQKEYANTDSSVWLAAGPHTGDGLRVNRCNQHDPAAGTIRDGVLWLPIGCVRALGGVNRRGGERYKLLAFSLADNAELERFKTFARQAGAVLVAAPPAWMKEIIASDPITTWAAVLFFSPFTEGYVSQRDGGGLLITSPWAASLAVLQSWTDPAPEPPSAPPVAPSAAESVKVKEQAGDRIDKLQHALACLLTIGPNASKIAKAIGVPRTTLIGWAEFKERYEQMQRDAEARKIGRRRGRRTCQGDFETDE